MPRKRVSRCIWDKTREPNAPLVSIIRAVLYELQPVDLTQFEFSIDDVRHRSTSACLQVISWLLSCARCTATFLYQRSLKQWGFGIGILFYWRTVVYLHKEFDAGPVVLILTALLLIFTIGLGDHQDGEALSAYSVFNKGFQNILGSVDADNLLAQHVGGGLAVNIGDNAGDDADAMHHRNEGGEEEEERPQLQQQQPQGEPQPVQGQEQQRRPRMSNKKQRRKRNIQQRREMQQQRQAAAAMGFGDNELNQERDQMAMNRLIEDQVQAHQ